MNFGQDQVKQLRVEDIEHATDFVELVGNTYRAYRPGMKEQVRKVVLSLGAEGLKALYEAVVRAHDKESAPKVAELYKIAGKAGIGLGGSIDGISVFCCKDCGALYIIADRTPAYCVARLADQVCGGDYATKIVSQKDNDFSYWVSQQKKALNAERQELKKMQMQRIIDYAKPKRC